MKCNPLRWLLGLLPLVGLWWVGILGTQERVEDDLARRVRAHLDGNGLQWAGVAFKGRDAVLTGRAEEESDQRRPALEAAKVWGVRALEDRIDVLQLVRNYVWSAAARGNQLVLTGYVPNEAARKAILAAARSYLPKHKVDDRMEPARGAPDQKIFISGTQFALRHLANLKAGGKASLEGAGLVIEGEAESARGYEAVRTALNSGLPAGISLKSDRVIPPEVKPYTWGATLRNRRIELTGHAPSIAARNAVKAAAERALPGGTVVDRMTLASGAPGDWQRIAIAALGRLGQLKLGNAEMTDRNLALSGQTETEAEAQAVTRGLRGDVPAPWRLTGQIVQDPAVKAAEEARRRAAEEAARRAAAEAEARRRLDEEQRQQQALAARRAAEEEAARRLSTEETERRRLALEEERRKREQEEAQRRAAEEEARRRVAEAEAQRRAAEEQVARARVARAAEAKRCQAELTDAAERGTILFSRASADLDRRSNQTLNSLARIMKSCPGFEIEIGGHTDSEGEPDRNQRLSDRRANAVLEYLLRAGVPQGSLKAVGYGQERPRVPNDSPANMAKNRRIEFNVQTR